MKVLVTGGSGFVGGNLARVLLEEGYRVRALVREQSNRTLLRELDVEMVAGDLLEPDSLRSALKGCDGLFHVAAAYTFWTPSPQAIYRANVEGTRNILAAAAEANVRKIVYTSTEATIGIHDGAPGTEEHTSALEELPGHYKRSKLLAERLALQMCGQGLPLVVVNPTMPIGPGDLRPTPTGKVIVDFLNRRMPAFVHTGMNVVDVDDVARGHLRAFESGRIGQRYILGNRNLMFKEMLDILAQITGVKAPRIRLPIAAALAAACGDELFSGRILGRTPGITIASVQASRKVRHFDCSKAIRELGLPQTPVEEAFGRAVGWFRRHEYAPGA